ncbi:large subunit ribosomal protein L25 [Desulfobaculum xiamenense]|uniref:Large ribosomal subunit protein bL25 n=1 Tax=Desulfobaculum xiamenense TaxID=995050 RepID=A0A846QPE4_9BACT|nr:50S ribosomal protein L25 [Desulfobaculum xiamenense]NJB66579.1 large subunit ribosomal protein L25 [Desulfobaculum xiamenense]
MSEQVMLKAAVREETGKGSCRALRTQKMVPGVFYSKGENILIQVPEMPLNKVFGQVGTSRLVSLEIEGKEACPAIFKEMIRHPFKPEVTHFDIFGVDMNKPVRVTVALKIVGRAPAMAMGAKLEIYRSSAVIECLPGNLPESINIDITAMQVNETKQIEDLALPEGVKIIHDDNFAVLRLIMKGAEKEEAEE